MVYCFSACRSEDPIHFTLTKDTKQENKVKAVCVLLWLCELNNDTVCESSSVTTAAPRRPEINEKRQLRT